MSSKNYTHSLKVELFYLVKTFRTPSLGDSISVALRKLLQGGWRGSQTIFKFATNEEGSLNIKIRYHVKEFSFLCMGRCKPLGSLNYSFHVHLSYFLFPFPT